ncbi:hypothetical protein ANN_27452 [Periplaneta americana]|uniref:Uncharacterized protein n=1 Tax=Periplaneta americana TaxID=6978 RepID=A0ABQ8RVY7_PERAM|nr:hypothetical protein ANN_27452 [Periplaneta americana]
MKNNELVKRSKESEKTSFITLIKQLQVKPISGNWKRRLSQQALYWIQNTAEDLKKYVDDNVNDHLNESLECSPMKSTRKQSVDMQIPRIPLRH